MWDEKKTYFALATIFIAAIIVVNLDFYFFPRLGVGSVFKIWHRKPTSSSSDSRGVRIVIPYWFGWGPFSLLVFWNLMNIQMGYWQWQNISNGIVGLQSRNMLHVSEIFASFGFCILVWLAAGREIISVDSAQLRIRKEIMGLGWSRQHAITDFYVQAGSYVEQPGWNSRAAVYLCLDIDEGDEFKVASFGDGLTLEDAARIEKLIRTFLISTTTAS